VKRSILIRRVIFLMCCMALLILCGMLGGFDSVLKIGLFILVAVVPLVVGSVAIYRFAWHRERLTALLGAGLLGLVATFTFLLGSIFDPDSTKYSWGYLLSVSVGVGVIVFIFALAIASAYGTIFRSHGRTKE